MLIPRFAIVFQLSHDLLFDFVNIIVTDWRLEHGGRWQENYVFLDGLEFGLERNPTGSPALKTRSFDDFIDSLSNFLNQPDSSVGNGCTATTPTNTIDMFRSQSSTRKRRFLRETAPSLSGSSSEYKRVKKEQKIEELSLSDLRVTEISNTKAHRTSSRFQGREWRRVEGYGPCFSVYELRCC